MIKKYGFWLVILLWLIYILSFVDRQIVAVLAAQIRLDLSLSNVQIGLLYGTAFSFVYAFAGIPMGRLADRWSRKGMIIIGLVVWSSATIASGFAGSFAALVSFRMVLGVSQAMLSPAAYALLAEQFPAEKRARVFSWYASGIFVGVGLSFLVGGTVAMNSDWRTAMIAVGIPGLILAPFAWVVIRDVRAVETVANPPIVRETIAQLRFMLAKPSLRWHLIGFAALACTGYSVLAFFSTIMTDVFDRPDLIRNYGWFIFGVAGSVVLAGWTADRLARTNPVRRYWVGFFAATVGLPLYYFGLFADNGFIALMCLGSAVLFSSCYNGVAAALIQFYVTSEMRALAGGVYLFVISVAGFGLGPPLTGWLMDYHFTGEYAASKALFSVILGCSLLGVVSFMMAMKTYEKDTESSSIS